VVAGEVVLVVGVVVGVGAVGDVGGHHLLWSFVSFWSL